MMKFLQRVQLFFAAFVFAVGLGLLLVPQFAVAQTKPAPTPAPPASTPTSSGNGLIVCGNAEQKLCTVGDIFRAVIVITNELIALAGVVAIVVIIISGFQMVIANGNAGDLAAAKGRLYGAFWGIFLVSTAFMLVNTLFSGSFGLGIQSGADAIVNPLQFINDAPVNTPTKTP